MQHIQHKVPKFLGSVTENGSVRIPETKVFLAFDPSWQISGDFRPHQNTQKLLIYPWLCLLTDCMWCCVVPPYWTPRGNRIHIIEKDCITQQACADKQVQYRTSCVRDWYLDWQCVECCTGDLCNYYVTVSLLNLSASFLLWLIFRLHRMHEMQTIVTTVCVVCLSRGGSSLRHCMQCAAAWGHSVQPLPNNFGCLFILQFLLHFLYHEK